MKVRSETMKGKVFLSYRREDASGWAIALYNVLCQHLDDSRIFMDVDTLEAGGHFVEVIENAVKSCKILVTLVGRRWLSSKDDSGRRIDNPHDLVRLEIESALKAGIRVVPVLVDGANMPRSDELPEGLAGLARRQAFELRHSRFRVDVIRLVTNLKILMGIDDSEKLTRKILISCNDEEYAPMAERLKMDLMSLGYEVWCDRERVRPKVGWQDHIAEGLQWLEEQEAAGLLLLLLTRPDLDAISGRTDLQRGIRILPVLVTTIELPTPIKDGVH